MAGCNKAELAARALLFRFLVACSLVCFAWQVLPAPDMPARVEMQWHRAQWILYRLRRAHLDGPPTQLVKALASAGAA